MTNSLRMKLHQIEYNIRECQLFLSKKISGKTFTLSEKESMVVVFSDNSDILGAKVCRKMPQAYTNRNVKIRVKVFRKNTQKESNFKRHFPTPSNKTFNH